ncbi:CheY-like chemotaxis protein [Paraburkholderia sp. GAS199]|uniref:response regulator n=1 Tax=Paraburkholderia sp. GAS199 TaxID=3035126 RepID=UPI003D19D353
MTYYNRKPVPAGSLFAAKAANPGNLTHFRVLVVDDNRLSADGLCAYLAAGGLTVRAVYNGSDALREVRTWAPDCIVLDIAMPGLSGVGVAATLRRTGLAADAAVLAYTAFDATDHIDEMASVGFDAIFRKPDEFLLVEAWILRLAGNR